MNSANNRNVKNNLRRKRNRNRAKRRIFTFLFIIMCISIGIVMFKAPFFNISGVTCTGNEKVSTDEIVNKSKIAVGDNIFSTNIGNVEKRIAEIPYVSETNVRRIFPNKIKIWIREAVPALIIHSNDKFALVSINGRVLEVADNIFEGYSIPVINGYNVENPNPSDNVSDTDNERFEKVVGCLKIMEGVSLLGKTGEIDVSNLNDIELKIDNRLTVYVGSYEEMDYKLNVIKKLMDERNITEYEHSVLNYKTDKLYVSPITAQEANAQKNIEPTEDNKSEEVSQKENKEGGI